VSYSGSLFDDCLGPPGARESLRPGALLLRGYARPVAQALIEELVEITRRAPFRHMSTPGAYRMSVGMTNCGTLGWITDRRGYRYERTDPVSSQPWPGMPEAFLDIAVRAATEGGYPNFGPDACLINRYEAGARLSLHQDKNEQSFRSPVVSVSLGLPAIFQFGGLKRSDPLVRVRLEHGDVVVWGGPSRLCYHGILPLKDGSHPATGNCRLNLTFRHAT